MHQSRYRRLWQGSGTAVLTGPGTCAGMALHISSPLERGWPSVRHCGWAQGHCMLGMLQHLQAARHRTTPPDTRYCLAFVCFCSTAGAV